MIQKESWYKEAAEKSGKRFYLLRHNDIHGKSGEGHVLDGIEWPNGKVSVCWASDTSSVTVYDSFEDFEILHVEGHGEGSNEVVWVDKR